MPAELEALARRAGFVGVAARTEELTANWFGWWTRTVEAMVAPGVLPAGYPWLAYEVWRRLYALDTALARVVPRDVFYNCVLTAVTPPAVTPPAVTPPAVTPPAAPGPDQP